MIFKILFLVMLSALAGPSGLAAPSCAQVFAGASENSGQYPNPNVLKHLLKDSVSADLVLSKLSEFLTRACVHEDVHLVSYLKPITANLESSATPSLLSVFKYFDLMTLSNLYRAKIKEIPSLDFVAKATRGMEERIAAVDVKKIKTYDDFAQAAGLIREGPMVIRNFSVVMSSEDAKAKAGLLLSPQLQHSLIDKSQFIGIAPLSKKNPNQVEVEYLSLARILNKNLYKYFSPELKAKLLDFKARNPTPEKVDARSYGREASALLRASLRELVGQLFHPHSRAVDHLLNQMAGTSFVPDHFRSVLLYQAFISIHPFEDGNGRSSRLYYEWVTQNLEGHVGHLKLASFDADLFLPRTDFKNFAAVSELLNAWIANAKNEDQFRERLTVSRQVIEDNYQYLVPLFN